MPTRRDLPCEVRNSPIHGSGVFATRRIRRGQRIMEYDGEHIDQDTANERYDDDAMERHHTFLFGLDDGVYIDGGVDGNAARFINHSCDPNSEAIDEDGRVFIYALRTIQPDHEITYDYNLEREGPMQPEWEQLYACRCGADNCRGIILRLPK